MAMGELHIRNVYYSCHDELRITIYDSDIDAPLASTRQQGSHRFYDNASHISDNLICIKGVYVGVFENNSIIFLCSFQ